MRSTSRQFKNTIYEQLGRIGKALASPRRLELLDLLCQGPRTVEALAKEAGLSHANTFQHLLVLRSARLVEAEKKGLFVTYRLAEILLDRDVVAYCRGPYCVLALQAVELLRVRGFQARRMADGIPDHRALGLPIETTRKENSDEEPPRVACKTRDTKHLKERKS